ncbi:hypothetical protein FISHEDRAFT_34713, partial [Fistulina hepatica ATCC 64428]
MSDQPSSSRPVTSKARGICKYYKEPRGCFSGKNCKFLHGEPGDANAPKFTRYDEFKTCRYFANGYCKRGADCWFIHAAPAGSTAAVAAAAAADNDATDNLCSICFEVPTTFGLLSGCGHVFCVQCIRQWRNSQGKTGDMIESGNTKCCPMCRAPSKFITPSSVFIKHGDPAKGRLIASYKASMGQIPCKYFQQSRTSSRPHCPFGRGCFYQHLNADGTPYIF